MNLEKSHHLNLIINETVTQYIQEENVLSGALWNFITSSKVVPIEDNACRTNSTTLEKFKIAFTEYKVLNI